MTTVVILVLMVCIILAIYFLKSHQSKQQTAAVESEQAEAQIAERKANLREFAAGKYESSENQPHEITLEGLHTIESAYAKFKQDTEGWEAKLQNQHEFSAEEMQTIAKERLKYHMYFDQVFYGKQNHAVATEEWRKWTDAFNELFARHTALTETEEEEVEMDDDEEYEDEEHIETAEKPSENIAEDVPVFKSEYDVLSAEFIRPAELALQLSEEENKGRQKELSEYAARRNLSKREAGDRYERYLGYLYERAGWIVEYYGLTEGIANSNRGIDLICQSEAGIHFVQTKYWSESVAAKTNINNVIDRVLKNMDVVVKKRGITEKVTAVLAARPKLSAEVHAYAQEQGVILLDNLVIQPYPLVKCSTGKRGAKKYFLPFLQEKTAEQLEEAKQGIWEAYDLVKMNVAAGDKHVYTIAQAEAEGYKYSNRA